MTALKKSGLVILQGKKLGAILGGEMAPIQPWRIRTYGELRSNGRSDHEWPYGTPKLAARFQRVESVCRGRNVRRQILRINPLYSSLSLCQNYLHLNRVGDAVQATFPTLANILAQG